MGRPREFDDTAVIDSAMLAFWRNGYANTSPALLAEATGVAKGSLYNAFGSKRELYDLALARYDELGAQVTEEYLSRPGTAREAIRGLLRHFVDDDLGSEDRKGCLAVNTAIEFGVSDPEIFQAVLKMSQNSIRLLRDRIDQGRRDGDVAAEVDPQAAAEFIMNTIGGLRVMTKTYDADTLYKIIDTALNCL